MADKNERPFTLVDIGAISDKARTAGAKPLRADDPVAVRDLLDLATKVEQAVQREVN